MVRKGSPVRVRQRASFRRRWIARSAHPWRSPARERVQRRVHQSDGKTLLGEVTARRADRFLRRDRVLRRLVKEPRVVAQTRLRGVTELLDDDRERAKRRLASTLETGELPPRVDLDDCMDTSTPLGPRSPLAQDRRVALPLSAALDAKARVGKAFHMRHRRRSGASPRISRDSGIPDSLCGAGGRQA
jgi:hypothetical protein